jgi:hypothetical protein
MINLNLQYMKQITAILTIALLIMAGCGEGKQSTDDVLTVDVTKRYPRKELILQDFLDVEYIVMEDADDFLNRGQLMAVGEELIVVINMPVDGNIFLFDRTTGKAVRKINRKGQSGEEYTTALRIILDEDNGEIFVNDINIRKLMVYDLYGNYQRSLSYNTEDTRNLNDGLACDNEHLILYDEIYTINESENHQTSFVLLSKQDGSIARKIQIPYEKWMTTNMAFPNPETGRTFNTHAANLYPIVPYFGDWILTELSSDTVYRYSPDDRMLNPFIARTPSIHSMNPEVFLFMTFLTDRYYFMESVKKEYDIATRTGFPSVHLIYDRQEHAIFEYTLFNADYADKRPVVTSVPYLTRPLNAEIAFWQKLESYQLVEDYGKGLLKGRLKEIAAELDAESNPVIMLAKHRKQ